MADKLPEEMTKGELLVELLYKGETNLANTTKLNSLEDRIELLEGALRECSEAANSLEQAASEMIPVHLARIRGAVAMAFPVEDAEGV